MGIVTAIAAPGATATRAVTRRTAVSSLVMLGAGALGGGAWPRSLSAKEPARVTFSGFQRNRNGDSLVFVHIDRQTESEISQQGTRFTVRLIGAKITVPNNEHVLDLRHFNVLILSSQLVPRDGDVELRIELREPAVLDTDWIERENGQASLHVRIPANA